MPEVVTTCEKCGAGFGWNTDYTDSMPNCPGCGYNQNQKYLQSSIDGLIRMLQRGSTDDKNHAAAELGRRGDSAAVEALIAAFRDHEAIVVLPAIYSLGKIGDPRAVEPLIRILKHADHLASSAVAAVSLAQIGTSEALQAVSAKLGNLEKKPP